MYKKLWHDPVWSKVIAGIILGLGALGLAHFLNWWPALGRQITSGHEFLLSSNQVQNWVVILLAVLSLPTILLACYIVFEKLFPSSSTETHWRNYRMDNFHGLRWRWKFEDEFIYDMSIFCPACDFQVYPMNASSYSVDRIRFRCDACGTMLGEHECSFEVLEDRVKRSIQHKLRNGTWPGNVKTQHNNVGN